MVRFVVYGARCEVFVMVGGRIRWYVEGFLGKVREI